MHGACLHGVLQKKGIWRAIAKEVWTLGVYGRQSKHCQKRWEDLRRWARKTAEAQLGMASQRGRSARRTLTPLMARIMAVVYLELDGPLRASQQPQGGAEAPATEGAASHKTQEAESTDGGGTSGTGARGAPRQRQEGTVRRQIPPPMEAPGGGGHFCATDTPVQAPPSQQPVSELAVPTQPGGWASPSPQASQALPQFALVP
ncbi:hypothetical protein NDU88_001653 [Pleurodeles waltl]|uniref:Myb/SANT-like DNA-binding domain-containing protein n=1 Tax=Pleurodeles waltl TaxID=8319 RepID=A0AAV7U916_PLEWA|nr:hypothetical protein NDU88_001653 [Pleurodeles waltl]